ncbi:hypothetical protein ARALYDRAFT_892609 [Arabidopsis lyrata subsp. lyrata]|uniref:Uncharacterized protein n=1 Tax=Arabidopsis lyrata subsp. lyrata TaxID=81972 RepID=D7KN45_ARALL|nr:hypothetical protein ARALYDRAFT_892609 [Arabidopsis lyrata subsp. lyrata]
MDRRSEMFAIFNEATADNIMYSVIISAFLKEGLTTKAFVLVISGSNKHLINGKLAQPSQVQNLFHSVQLNNVNNPHFLIMQGRITKVLNMKPPEILWVLEQECMKTRKKECSTVEEEEEEDETWRSEIVTRVMRIVSKRLIFFTLLP